MLRWWGWPRSEGQRRLIDPESGSVSSSTAKMPLLVDVPGLKLPVKERPVHNDVALAPAAVCFRPHVLGGDNHAASGPGIVSTIVRLRNTLVFQGARYRAVHINEDFVIVCT